MNYNALTFCMAACAVSLAAAANACTITSYGCVSELEDYNRQEEVERLRYENQRLRNQRNWEGNY